MPRRPPKEWFYQAVESIKRKRPQVTNPSALAGWIWKYGMKPASRRAAMKGEYDPQPVNSLITAIPLQALIENGIAKPIEENSQVVIQEEALEGEKITAEEANYVSPGPQPFICQNCIFRDGDYCEIVQGPYEEGQIKPGDTCRLFQAMLDPAVREKMPKLSKYARPGYAVESRRWGEQYRHEREKTWPTLKKALGKRGREYGRRIADPKNRKPRLQSLDPQEIAKPIDIYGYGNKNSASMLRLVPDVPGFIPENIEQAVDPVKGGMVNMVPGGSLVEIQVKFPRHQWENEILPKMKEDPTNEIDLDHRRIVRRAKRNIATNIFIDGD